MRLLPILLCGCIVAEPQTDHDFRSSDCQSMLTLTLSKDGDEWRTTIKIVQADCSGEGSGWNSSAPECAAIVDATRDYCEILERGEYHGHR
jgi:hypothetical protein